MPDPEEPLDREAMQTIFCEMVPHAKALGLSLVASTPVTAHLRLPWHPRLIGNPETRVPHGGVVTTLLDACCGIAVYFRLQRPVPIATLDLRIDSLRAAEPDRDLFARADCYKTTRNIAFVRAIAYQDEADPVANAAATFMLSTKGGLEGFRP